MTLFNQLYERKHHYTFVDGIPLFGPRFDLSIISAHRYTFKQDSWFDCKCCTFAEIVEKVKKKCCSRSNFNTRRNTLSYFLRTFLSLDSVTW